MSKAVHLEELSYTPDSCAIFERLRDLPGAAFFDSSYPHSSVGRFDILCAAPLQADVPVLAPTADAAACARYFDELRRCHRELFGAIQPASQDIPFSGGLLGYLGYGLGNALHKIPVEHIAAGELCQLQAYNWCVVQDHLLQRAVLVTLPDVSAATRRDISARLQRSSAPGRDPFRLRQGFACDLDAQAYRAAFAVIQDYIQAGDCYQVNLARHFEAAFSGDPWQAYRQLRAVAAAPFSAYLTLGDNDALLSLSPERFISLHGHRVETSPIKGTRPRSDSAREDRQLAAELQGATKDRAENLMIVDLLRNDLGRSCTPGSIHVDRLFEVQSFPTVHHLVSTISGELSPDRSAFELLRDSFPGGSITGAPKKRAMEIIAELESGPRGPYCGSLLYVSADGRMDSNIAIRTLLCQDDTIHCWAGGGIVADSQWQAEYQETADKVGRFLQLLEHLPSQNDPPQG